VLFEHGGSDLQVICATSEGEVKLVTTIGELLPHAFRWQRD
jgi:cytidine deaminase